MERERVLVMQSMNPVEDIEVKVYVRGTPINTN